MKILVWVSIFLPVGRVAMLPFPLICVSDYDFKVMALEEAGVYVPVCACARVPERKTDLNCLNKGIS